MTFVVKSYKPCAQKDLKIFSHSEVLHVQYGGILLFHTELKKHYE